jgi:hypothetical protein
MKLPPKLADDLKRLLTPAIYGDVEKLIADHLEYRDHLWLRIVELHCPTEDR